MADGVEDGQQGVRGECGKRGCPKRLKRRGTGPSERALNPTSKLRYADKNSSARQITVLIRISTSNCTRKSEWKRETGWKEIHKSTWRLRLTWTWLNPPINEYQNGKITTVEYSINRRKERDVPHFNPLRMNPFQINNLREPITRITETIISISPSPPPPPFIPFSFPSFSFLPPSLFCNLGWKTSIRRRKSDRRIHHQTNANSRNLDRRCHVFFNSASKIHLKAHWNVTKRQVIIKWSSANTNTQPQTNDPHSPISDPIDTVNKPPLRWSLIKVSGGSQWDWYTCQTPGPRMSPWWHRIGLGRGGER